MVDVGENIHRAIDELLDRSMVTVDSNVPVILKPNLCCIKSAETGATTDPLVVEALIGSIRRRFNSKEFFVAESDATALNADLAFRLLGYEEVARRAGARIVNLSSMPFKHLRFPQNYFLHNLKIPELFLKPHFLISVGKLKTYSSERCGFTGTLKNVYGCNPEPFKAKYHRRLHEAIADIASAFRPDFSVVDSIIAMEGNGPVSGTPIRLNKIIAGRDPVAVDSCIARLIGIDPKKIDYILLSEKAGLGSTAYKIDCRGLECLQLRLPTSVTDKLILHVGNLTKSLKRNREIRY